MYTGPVKQRPEWPFMRVARDFNSCERDAFLTERDMERKFEAQNHRCEMRKRRPGFAKIDDLRYGG